MEIRRANGMSTMNKLRLLTSASAMLTAAGVTIAFAQTPGTSGATETMTGTQQASVDFITCEDIVDLDDVAAGQVVYYVAGYLEGQRVTDASADVDSEMDLDEDVVSDPAMDLGDDNAEIDDETVLATGVSGLLNIELDVQQVRTICEDDPRMPVTAIVEQVGG